MILFSWNFVGVKEMFLYTGEYIWLTPQLNNCLQFIEHYPLDSSFSTIVKILKQLPKPFCLGVFLYRLFDLLTITNMPTETILFTNIADQLNYELFLVKIQCL